MNDQRASAAAVLLTNGQVLVTGGGGDATSETYDPGSASWINWVNMNDERQLHACVRLTNGQVLVAGGINDNTADDLSSAEIYDPGSATWTSITPMPYAADSLAGVLLTNGTVLICGGNYNGSAVTNAVIYYPKTQTWTNTAGMNEARGNHGATLLRNGNVLVEGGTYNNSAEIYDPVAGTWSVVASMNDGRDLCNAVLLTNGEVMVSGDGNPDVELYDPVQNKWSYTASLPTAGYNQTETLMSNGWVVVTGGDESQYNGPATNVIETYSLVGSPTTGAPSLNVTDLPLSGAAPVQVIFSSPGTDSQGNTVTNWSWNFGDGGRSAAQNPTHTYTNAGTYPPILTAYSTYGSQALNVSGPGAVTVTNLTISASANPISGPIPLIVHFTSASVDSGGYTVTNWSWTFGDGSTSAAQNPTHTYTNVGIYYPGLTGYSTHSSYPLAGTYFGFITATNSPNPLFRTIYSFSATTPNNQSIPTNSEGSGPNGSLVLNGQMLYGIAGHGGINGGGTIFALATDGTFFTNLYTFSLNNGEESGSGLTLSGSMLYGTTSVGGGGSQGGGTVFGISTNGTGYTNYYHFTLGGASVGSEPSAGVVLSNNVLYGATVYGGAYSEGAIFSASLTTSNIFDLHSFLPFSGNNINSDGLFPFETLIISGPTLYGTTENGGTSGAGTVFSVSTNSPYNFATLHYFSSPVGPNTTNSDGAYPFAGLVLSGTNLYGTTYYGGTYGYGTIYAVSTNASGPVFTNLYSFTGGSDGGNPKAGLVLSGNMLYGLATIDGKGNGTIFAVRTDGTGFTTLYSFGGGNDGSTPAGNMVLGGDTLYGTAAGGSAGSGTIFSYTLPAPQLSIRLSRTNAILSWSTLAPTATPCNPRRNSRRRFGTPGFVTAKSRELDLNTVTNPIANTKMFYRLVP